MLVINVLIERYRYIIHTCQLIQFTCIKYIFFIILGGCGHIGKWIQENIIFMRFCWCFKLSEKIEKLLNEEPTHTITKCTLTCLVQQAKKSCRKRFEAAYVYFTHCFFLPMAMPHVPVGIQNAAATSKKTKDPGLHKGNTSSQLWTKVYSQKGLAIIIIPHAVTIIIFS